MNEPSPAFDPIISDLAGDADLIDIVIEFVGEMPSRVEALAKALQDENFEQLRRLAHQMKGAAGGYGFQSITDAASKLERATDRAMSSPEASIEAVREEVNALADLCRRARAS